MNNTLYEWRPIGEIPEDLKQPGQLVILWVNWSDGPGWTQAKWSEDCQDGRTGWWNLQSGGRWWLIPEDIITHWMPNLDFPPPGQPSPAAEVIRAANEWKQKWADRYFTPCQYNIGTQWPVSEQDVQLFQAVETYEQEGEG